MEKLPYSDVESVRALIDSDLDPEHKAKAVWAKIMEIERLSTTGAIVKYPCGYEDVREYFEVQNR